jgi:hypothetical protein
MVLVDPQFYNYPSYLDPEVQNALAEALPSPGSTLWTKFLATIGVTRLKPLMVLSAGARDPLPGASQEQSDRFNEAWTKSGADLTRLSGNSEHIVAEDSAHNIQDDDPELVIDVIRQVVEAVRNGGSV